MPTPEQSQSMDALWDAIPSNLNRGGAKGHAQTVLASLTPDEMIHHLAIGAEKLTWPRVGAQGGVLAVTTRRFLFVGGIRNSKPKVFDIPIANVTAVRCSHRILSSKVTVVAGERTHLFEDVQPKAAAEAIVTALDPSTRPAPASAASAAQPPASLDIPEQIRKLSELRDAGILTTEEFESKKAALLARL